MWWRYFLEEMIPSSQDYCPFSREQPKLVLGRGLQQETDLHNSGRPNQGLVLAVLLKMGSSLETMESSPPESIAITSE